MARSLNTLNILHLLLVLSAGGCLYFAWQETRDKVVKLDRLFRAPLFSIIVALILVGSSRVDLQACKLEYSIVSPK